MTERAELTLEERVTRLEALDQIRQLAAKYALALDMRDFDVLANLFVPDIGVPGSRRGRAALKRWYAETMRSVPGSFHGINGHVIDIESADSARGLVYSRNDLDLGDAWMLELMVYLDQYAKIDGVWYFARRTPLYWVHTDPNTPPLGPDKLRRPGSERAARGGYHDAFPSWEEFWAHPELDGAELRPAPPIDRFIDAFRRGAPTPRVNPKGS